MDFIKWNDTLSVNIGEIDQEHQQLINTINQIHHAMKEGKSKEILQSILEQLTRYTTDHFLTEKRYFDQYDYPEKDSHQKEHDEFVARVLEFKQGFDQGKLFVSIEILNFLNDWLITHIQGSDQKYAKFLNQKGIT